MNVHMSKQDTGFAGLTCGPPNNELGSFELYVKGRKITLIYTITPDSTFTKYVLSTKSRSGEKHVFMDMRSLVRYCKIQAVELSNDDRDYEAIRDLEALRAAKSCESDICSEMGSLQLQEKRRIRFGGRRSTLPPVIDRTTKPNPDRGALMAAGNPMPGASYNAPSSAYKRSMSEQSPLNNKPPVSSEYYMKHAASGAVKKIELDGDYGWLSNFQ